MTAVLVILPIVILLTALIAKGLFASLPLVDDDGEEEGWDYKK